MPGVASLVLIFRLSEEGIVWRVGSPSWLNSALTFLALIKRHFFESQPLGRIRWHDREAAGHVLVSAGQTFHVRLVIGDMRDGGPTLQFALKKTALEEFFWSHDDPENPIHSAFRRSVHRPHRFCFRRDDRI